MTLTIEGGAWMEKAPFTLPANYQEAFAALPTGVYVKCSRCNHLHTNCDIIYEQIGADSTVTCGICHLIPSHAETSR